MATFLRMLRNEDGGTLVEYVLIGALVAGLISVAFHNFGSAVEHTTNDSAIELDNANAAVTATN